MDIVLLNDGRIMPFNIKLSRDSVYSLLSKTNDYTEELESTDGEIDFGTMLVNGEHKLKGVFEFKNRNVDLALLKTQFMGCISPQKHYYESNLDKYTMAHIVGKPEIISYPNFCEVIFSLSVYPLWLSFAEKAQLGNGILTNLGTFDTGLLIQISGPCSNPSFVFGGKQFNYSGTLTNGDVLVVDTLYKTVVKNGNIAAGWCGDFPALSPGSTSVTGASSNILFKWRDCWI